MKTKTISLLIAAVLVAGGVWYFTNKPQNNSEAENNQNSGNQENNSGTVVQEVPNMLKGQLLVSTDKKRGNLMLLLEDSDRIIYINTSRDFRSLIGKNVVMDIEGSLDDFRLVDIKAQ